MSTHLLDSPLREEDYFMIRYQKARSRKSEVLYGNGIIPETMQATVQAKDVGADSSLVPVSSNVAAHFHVTTMRIT